MDQSELKAWNSVGRRIATSFLEAADEVKAEEMKQDLPYRSSSGEKLATDRTNVMCSPTPSSIYPTDVSTTADSMGFSDVGSESGYDTDYDFLSELDDSDDDDAFYMVSKSSSISFKGTFAGSQAKVAGLKPVGADQKKENTSSISRGNWRCVGQRLASALLTLSDSE